MRTQPITLLALAVAVLLVGVVACLDVADSATGPPLDAPEVAEASSLADASAAATLTRLTGRLHTVEDIGRMGRITSDLEMARGLLDENVRELAGLRALQPEQGTPEAQRIEWLEQAIEGHRNTLAALAPFDWGFIAVLGNDDWTWMRGVTPSQFLESGEVEDAHPLPNIATPSDEVYAGVLTRITGKQHTTRDIQNMGMAAVQVMVGRDLLHRSERELADLRAAGGWIPNGSGSWSVLSPAPGEVWYG